MRRPEPPANQRTIPHTLAFWADATPDAPALRHGDSVLTYRGLDRAVRAAASRLVSVGITTGDRVVLVGGNSIGWVVSYLATLRLGAIIAPANNRLNSTQFVQQCDTLGAALVLYDEEHRHLAVAAAGPERDTLELAGVLRVTGTEAESPLPAMPEPESPALISFTSGTTGLPKGAVLTHSALVGGSRAFRDHIGSGPEDSTLIVVPLFHNTGFVDQLGHMLLAGGRTDLLTKFKTAAAVEEYAAHPVTFVTAVPSILRLLMVADGGEAVYANARVVLFGGSPMPGAWTQELLRRWPHLTLIHGYGLTEFTSVCTFLPADLISTKGESVGLPAAGVILKVVDESGADQPTMTDGEVLVSGPTLMTEYWGQPELTADKIHDGWLRTGDLGHLDEDGLLWLSGRVDDVINRGGEKVLPSHVESCLAEESAVSDAAVFGYDDPILQSRVAAAIEPRPGRYFDEAATRRHLLTLLPDYAVPERWIVYERLPRTASGKVDRKAVARHYQEGTSRSPEES
ncbi:class I adenylate-forming enzyme family protein [Streptomyces sp. NPDC051572]|uniref:class I adenylate-forming enzyme family protein n=1 Tax=unclassified Streptomyces TaxID=2593676 RepID=UPI0034507D0E